MERPRSRGAGREAEIAPTFGQPTDPDPRSADETAARDEAFCLAMLPKVSRTFALSILALPPGLRESVGVSYLLCRIVDTIEDDAKMKGRRGPLFDAFDTALAAADGTELERLARAADLGGSAEERELVRGSASAFRVYRSLSRTERDAIAPPVAEMSRGMREYAARADGSATGLRLTDLADLERYCGFVAGTVGGLLTSLFLTTIPAHASWKISEAERRGWLYPRAARFGLGLQLVNVLKDVASDFDRGACYLPESIAEKHGVSLARLLDAEGRERASGAIREIAAVARAHLDVAAEYTLAWPVDEDATGRVAGSAVLTGGPAVRLFCAVPLALGYGTLGEIEQGAASLVRGRAPAVSGAFVRAVFAEALAGARSDEALRSLFERCRRTAPP
jgi:farnesyl-diphosphate farnesyltransferase